MTALVEQGLDFRAASAAVGAEWKDSAALAVLRARAARLASELDWPDSHASRPWKYYDATRIGLTPETACWRGSDHLGCARGRRGAFQRGSQCRRAVDHEAPGHGRAA